METTETYLLAAFLAGHDRDANGIKEHLHWFGFRGFTSGFMPFLEVMSKLEPWLLSLRAEYPNLEPALSRLLIAKEFRAKLSTDVALQLQHGECLPGTGFEIAAPQEWFNVPNKPVWPTPVSPPVPIQFAKDRCTPAFLKLFAVSIVLDLVWSPYRHHQNDVFADSLAPLTDFKSHLPSHILWPGPEDLLQGASSSSHLQYKDQIAERRLVRFDEHLILAIEMVGQEVPASQYIQLIVEGFRNKAAKKGVKPKEKKLLEKQALRFESLEHILANTQLDKECRPVMRLQRFAAAANPNLPDKTKRATERKWANRATVNLTDRQLLGEHDTALTQSIRDSVGELLRCSEVPSSELRTESQHNLEALGGYLLRICLSTGQLIDKAEKTRVMPHDLLVQISKNQPLSTGVISYLPSDLNSNSRKYLWNPPGSPPIHNLEILWPPHWETHCTNFSIGEILPLRADAILPEIKEFVAKRIKKREPTSRIFIKHALGREIFAFNTNRAAIRYICGGSNADEEFSPERSSLHHYITFNSSAVTNAYRVAQARLFQKDTLITKAGFLTEHTAQTACMVIEPRRIRFVLEHLRKEIEQSNIQNPIQLHNNFAQYITFVLLLCSGHRETKQLFHFAFSLNLKDAIAFLSDKQRVGSEARFVPLTATAMQLIKAYFTHITWLIHVLELDANPLAEEVKIACGIRISLAPREANSAGLFFKIVGGALRPMGTDDIARTVAGIETRDSSARSVAPAITARTLRRNLATYLANRGISGDGISFLLGHNGKLNLWGAASYRVPNLRLAAARGLLEEYLQINHANTFEATWAKGWKEAISTLTPTFETSNEAFEGRKQISDLASARARMAVLRVVDRDDLEERGISCIDDEVLKEIQAEVRFELGNDRQACEKVLTELARLVDRWRRAGKQNSSAALLNLTRFDPGPVGIEFGRHLAIANHIATRLGTSIKRYLDRGEDRVLNQLSVFASLLVITEAVLNINDLKALVLAFQNNGSTRHNGQIRVRASVETRYAKYERTCDLSDKCSAAAIGFNKLKQQSAHKGSVLTVYSWESIAAELDVFTHCLFDSDVDIGFKDLMLIMRPYWLLRLPGTIYSCCMGAFDTSAESKESTQMMLGKSPTGQDKPPVRVRKEAVSMDEAVQSAVDAIAAILANTGGKPEAKTSNKRAALAALRTTLNVAPLDQIGTWAAEQPIVELWLDFMRHLLAFGGPRTKTYAHPTLVKYQGKVIALLFKHGWDSDLRDFKKAEDFDNFYASIYSDINPKEVSGFNTVFKIFHQFLRNHIGAPRCKHFPSGEPRQRTARNVVLSQFTIARAMDLARHDGGRPTKFNDAAAGLIAINAKWGMRVMEGIGLLHRDLARGAFQEARVKRNTTRYIKTHHGTRRICVSLSSHRLYTEVNSIYAINEKYGKDDGGKGLIFADPDRPDELLESNQIRNVASWAIKESSGDMTAILYSLRHTWATAAMATFLLNDPTSPIAKALLAALPGLDQREIKFLRPSPDIYSLGVDRIAMWLGHASIDQVIPTYGHCIWWVCGDYCFKEAQGDPWSDVTIAQLLNVGRPGLLYHLSKAAESETKSTQGLRAQTIHAALNWYIKDAGVRSIADSLDKDGPSKALLSQDRSPKNLRLRFMEKMFDMRARNTTVTLTNLGATLTHEFDIPKPQADLLANAYMNLLKETRFRDFEPEEQRTGPDAKFGVLNGQLSRRTLLSKISTKLDAAPEDSETAANIARDWARNVNGRAPLLVSDTTSNLQSSLLWLHSLGYVSQDLVVHVYNAADDDLRNIGANALGSIDAKSPVSRHEPGVPTPEFGIDVVSGDALPIGRNFQRAMFALAVWERAGFLTHQKQERLVAKPRKNGKKY